jgi:deoxyadenosine/deoxycytidine kinase
MIFRPLIWVEGIIGVGKSTFSYELAKRLKLRLIEEPVETNPYLEPFYKDPKRYAFGMQVYLLHQRYAMQQLASYEATGVGGYAGAILDRSLSGDRVFAKLHRAHLRDGLPDHVPKPSSANAASLSRRSTRNGFCSHAEAEP